MHRLLFLSLAISLHLILLDCPLALALPESDLSIVREGIRNLPKFSTAHRFTGRGGLSIHSLEFTFSANAQGPVVVIVPGRGESSGKYFETAYDLGQGGVSSVFVIDHRGQGFSGRMLPDPQKGHVEDFADYTADLSRWIDEIVLPRSSGRRIVLVAHSMGGAITAKYLASISGTPLSMRFSALLLSSPMFGISWAGSWLERLAEASCKNRSPTCNSYVQGTGPYDPTKDTFEANLWTSSLVRFRINREFYATYPDTIVTGPTWGWLRQALLAMKSLRAQRNLAMPFPIFLFSAGADRIVDNAEEALFCQAQADCTFETLPNAQHSLLEEKDEWRSRVIEKILLLAKPN